MTVELITGYSGAPHIDSSDVQHLIAGVVGPGSYVLQTQNKLSLTVNSANKVTLNTGDAVIAGGAHVRVSAAEALTVASGTQGANRNDLVVLRYTKNSTTVESAQAVVIKGTATSGTASDPAYNTGSIIDGKTTVDMPLYRLPIAGVNLGAPVKLFSEQPSMKALGDSVSQLQANQIKLNFSSGAGINNWYGGAYKVGKVVVISLMTYPNFPAPWGELKILEGLPKPASVCWAPVQLQDSSNPGIMASITTGGDLMLVNKSNSKADAWCCFNLVYVAA